MAFDRRTRTLLIGFLVILLFLLLGTRWIARSAEPAMASALFSPVTTVRQRDFSIHVVEKATLDARQSVLLSSELPSNRAKSIYLAPEGELISAGDVVARFDPTPFEEDMEKVRNDIGEQRIKLAQARADLELQLGESDSRVAELQFQVELAKLKRDSLEKGGIPVRLAQARKELERTRAEFNTHHASLQTEQELFDKGLTNRKALKSARDRESESRAALELAQQNLKVLEEITLPAELRQASLQLQNREQELAVFRESRTQQDRKQSAAVAQIEHRIQALEQELRRIGEHLERTQLQAPVSGLVLYKEISIQGEKRRVQVGDSLWNRQGFAVIPDLSDMVAIVAVRESDVGKIEVGQSAVIQPEAYPALRLQGVVQAIGTLASGSERHSRSFQVRIALENSDNRLRPGMSAKASILVGQYTDATVVPVEAIFYEQQQAVVFLWRDGRPKSLAVELGGSDGKYIVVEDGLEPGQEVMLVYPDNFEAGVVATGPAQSGR